MGWPEDFGTWAENAHRFVISALVNQFGGYYAEDALQIAFEKAAKHRDDEKFFSNETRFKRWLLVVAKREILQKLRKETREEEWEDDVLPRESSAFSEEVWDSLQQLEDDDKRILLLYYYDGFTDSQVARAVNETPNRCWRRRQRALAHLRLALLKHGVAPEYWGIYPTNHIYQNGGQEHGTLE